MAISTEQVLTRKVGRLYLHYLIPTMFATLMGSVYGMADLFFIGNGVGGNSLAALSIATPMYCIFSCIVCLIGSGGATAMAVCAGEGDEEGANQLFTQAMLLLTGISLVLLALFQIFITPIARFLGATDELMPMVVEYMRIVTLATPGFLISWSLGSFIRNDGNPTLVMWASIVPNLFNVLMDYVFVYPCAMGIAGAALATALSPILGLLMMAGHFVFKKNHLRLVRPRFTWERIWRMLRNGASYCVQELSGAIMIFTYNAVLMGLGGAEAVSVYAVVMNVGWTVMMLIGGFIGAAQPIIGINVGGGKLERVRHAFRLALVWASVFCAVSTAAVLLFPGTILGLFNGGDPTLLAPMEHAGRLYFWMLIPATLNIAVLGLVQACEWFRQSLLISLSRSMVLLLLCLLVMSALFGLTGAWLAATVAEALTAVLSVLIYLALLRDFRAKEQLYKLGEQVQ